MSLRIKEIEPGSWAEELGILPEERILSINGNSISDFLDLQYYSGEQELEIMVERLNKERRVWKIADSWSKPLGITADDHLCRKCANNCIFCFIDQMPPGERGSLYIKDDDICFSFYYGNFVTLTNLSQKDFDKITEQHLSPLYISVHTTNNVLHKKMLRYNRDFDLMQKLRYLCEHEIVIHTQIVVVPGYNDKEELANTLSDLASLGEFCQSIGIVPVGLTRFRQNLVELKTITEKEARELLEQSRKYKRCWCSDEIYLKAGDKFPPAEFYQDFEQIENGIGMVRSLRDNWQEVKEDFFESIMERGQPLLFVTGVLVKNEIEQIAAEITAETGLNCRVAAVQNFYFGQSVTVAGLLTWQDVSAQVNLNENELAVFASNSFNSEGFMIDGVHEEEIAANWGGKIMLVHEQFESWEIINS